MTSLKMTIQKREKQSGGIQFLKGTSGNDDSGKEESEKGRIELRTSPNRNKLKKDNYGKEKSKKEQF